MDLKDVIATCKQEQKEAELAFHAGHHDNAEGHLMAAMLMTGKYFDEKTTPAGDVTESATSETPAENSKTTPAQPQGPAAQAAGIVPFVDHPKIHPASRLEKPNQ